MFCKKCGKQIENSSDFCRYCGTRNTLEDDTSPVLTCRCCGKPLKDEWTKCPACGSANTYCDDSTIESTQEPSNGDGLKQIARNAAEDITDTIFRAVKIMAVLLIIVVIVLFFKGEL